jgi:ABC-type Fe3+ transport system substrate-binding protein
MKQYTEEQTQRMRKFINYLMSDEFQAEWEQWVIELYESTGRDIERVLAMLNPEDDEEARTLIQVWESIPTSGEDGGE